MTLETVGAWKAVKQSLTPAIKSLLVLTSIHENTNAITIYMSIQVKVMNLIQPTPWPTRVGSVNRRCGSVNRRCGSALVVRQPLHQPTCWQTCRWDRIRHFYRFMQKKFLSNSIKAFLK